MTSDDPGSEFPLLVVAEFVFTPEGEVEFLRHRQRTLDETRGVDGCLQAVLWIRPGRRYQFSTLWRDADAVTRWVGNEFHRDVLMPGFRKWCTEGCFGEYALEKDHERARKCASCGRWTQGRPGWNERRPASCKRCDAPLEPPSDA
ncbi:MAG TPA: antibiotic biosynthesis monooxygenase [Myxococcota bacterium]|nr:antibiotic biosynthesis monooxygenase [Myxococcales bacterium]HPG27504.1 antibiotic biosynthesis monooxygenase [Myxococcota bacterium]